MYISPTEAIKMYDVSKPTLYKDMSEGNLSYRKDDRKRRKINIAELDRLYQKREGQGNDLTSNNVKRDTPLTELNVNNKHVAAQIKVIQEQIQSGHNREVELLNNQIEQLQNQIENLNKNLNKALDITALIEDKREEQGAKTSHWEQKFELMGQEINTLKLQNQKLISREEERKRRIEERRRQRQLQKMEEPPKKQNFIIRILKQAGQGA